MDAEKTERLILLTGASGYIGGSLLRRLEAESKRVRCLVRNAQSLRLPVSNRTEVVQGDVMDPSSLDRALEGVHTAYYLIHSMGESGDFAAKDAVGARNFAEAAARKGVRRIIYLGGLGRESSDLSKHLRSRQEVGAILSASGVPTVELRASVVIGAGSLSFELIRDLVEVLPIMITPKWVSVPAQPIAISDVLEYLVRALDLPESESRIFEIGGGDIVSYGGIMKAYAHARGLKRLMIPVPVLTPYLSSLWLGLVTPLRARVGRSLIEGVRSSTVVRDNSAAEVFGISPVGIAEAIRQALETEDIEFKRISLSEFFARTRPSRYWTTVRLGCRILDTRTARVSAPIEDAFRVVCSIGGKNGYFYADWLWRLRGLIDRLVGGVGMRRTDERKAELQVGDQIDWWTVEKVERNRSLRLRADMKVPGRAWLDFDLTTDSGDTVIRQTAIFDARGLTGRAYWWALYPAHLLVFSGLLRGIVERCKASSSGARRTPAQ